MPAETISSALQIVVPVGSDDSVVVHIVQPSTLRELQQFTLKWVLRPGVPPRFSSHMYRITGDGSMRDPDIH